MLTWHKHWTKYGQTIVVGQNKQNFALFQQLWLVNLGLQLVTVGPNNMDSRTAELTDRQNTRTVGRTMTVAIIIAFVVNNGFNLHHK